MWAKFNTWTRFMDMHSGGDSKEKAEYIFIEAPESEAKVIFYEKFGHDPERVSCACCGQDYSITAGEKEEDLAQITGLERGCRNLKSPRYKRGKNKGLYKKVKDPEFRAHFYLEDGEKPPSGYEVQENNRGVYSKYQSLREFMKRPDVLVIRKKDIKAIWRISGR
jgi:hypothetical protein